MQVKPHQMWLGLIRNEPFQYSPLLCSPHPQKTRELNQRGEKHENLLTHFEMDWIIKKCDCADGVRMELKLLTLVK
jgi:hypothetical protein